MTESATTADLLPYLSRPMTAPGDDVRVAIERGPVETGWCTLEDGTGYVAVRTHMAGVTAAMIDWSAVRSGFTRPTESRR